jgi:hypothetical protein
MANIGKWNTPTAIASQLTTELNSLGNNTMSAASTAYDNATNMNIYCDLEVNLASLSPTAGAYVAIYILEAPDGTNYPAQSDADFRLTTTQLFCVLPIGTTAATAQRVTARNLLLPPSLIKFKLDNQAGVALNASGNTVKILAYNVNLNG